jgi:hypothetical protein
VQAETEHPDCVMVVWPSADQNQSAGRTMPLYLDPVHVEALTSRDMGRHSKSPERRSWIPLGYHRQGS